MNINYDFEMDDDEFFTEYGTDKYGANLRGITWDSRLTDIKLSLKEFEETMIEQRQMIGGIVTEQVESIQFFYKWHLIFKYKGNEHILIGNKYLDNSILTINDCDEIKKQIDKVVSYEDLKGQLSVKEQVIKTKRTKI